MRRLQGSAHGCCTDKEGYLSASVWVHDQMKSLTTPYQPRQAHGVIDPKDAVIHLL